MTHLYRQVLRNDVGIDDVAAYTDNFCREDQTKF